MKKERETVTGQSERAGKRLKPLQVSTAQHAKQTSELLFVDPDVNQVEEMMGIHCESSRFV